jgi:hypothetical protein
MLYRIASIAPRLLNNRTFYGENKSDFHYRHKG